MDIANRLLNTLPDIRSMRYLELGLGAGRNFRKCHAKEKVGVDNMSEFNATFRMTTDEYFAQLSPYEMFDVIFIDACHTYDFVLRDWNNSVKHLSPGGLIFVHDLSPVNKKRTAERLAGDGYKILHYLWLNKPEVMTFYPIAKSLGMVCFFDPEPINPPPEQNWITYEQFDKERSKQREYTEVEMKEILKTYTRM